MQGMRHFCRAPSIELWQPAQMLRRGMLFEVIDWTSGQAELPLEN